MNTAEGKTLQSALDRLGLDSKQVIYLLTAVKGGYPDMNVAYAVCTKREKQAISLQTGLSNIGFSVYREGCLVIADSQS